MSVEVVIDRLADLVDVDPSALQAGAFLQSNGSKVVGAPSPGDLNFTFSQMTPSSSWTITHNLGKHPSVTIVDSGGTVVIGDVQYVSLNVVVLSFGAPFGGTAYLN